MPTANTVGLKENAMHFRHGIQKVNAPQHLFLEMEIILRTNVAMIKLIMIHNMIDVARKKLSYELLLYV